MSFNTFNSIQSFIRNVSNIIKSSFIYNFPKVTTDASLVLYYPLDTSKNNFTPNYASGLPVYDASMTGVLKIMNTNNSFITGLGDLAIGDLSFNKMGGLASNYVLNNTSFNLVPSNGLSISCWFSCSGQLNKIGTLLSLKNALGNSIELDISSTNILCSNYT